MGVITQHEQALYEDAWALPSYGDNAPSDYFLDLFREYATPPATVLDAGCGSGKGTLALATAGFAPMLCDLTPAGLLDAVRDTYAFAQTPLWADLKPVAYRAALEWEDTHGPCPFTGHDFDWVYCTDVLEHLPTQFTMLAVDQMLRVAKEGLFLTVHTQPDQFGVWVGRPLHQTVQPFVWWRDSLREIGHVEDARDLITCATFLVRRAA